MDDYAQIMWEAGLDVAHTLEDKGWVTLTDLCNHTREEYQKVLTPGQLNRLIAALLALGYNFKDMPPTT